MTIPHGDIHSAPAGGAGWLRRARIGAAGDRDSDVKRRGPLPRVRIGLTGAAGMLLATLLVPAPALAHGLVGKTDLAIPRWLFAWAAGIVLVVSFVALASLWPKPRLERLQEKRVWRYPRVLDPLCGALGVALFGVVVYAGLAGEQIATANLLPTWIYVIFWVGLAFTSLLLGDIFRAFNPWRAIARGVAWAARVARKGRPLRAPRAYPEWLGRWPAVAGVLGFAWLELVYVNKDEPQLLAWMALAYAAVQLAAMSAYGIDAWSNRGDPFSVYFGLFARLAPLRWRDGALYRRAPFVGVIELDVLPGTVALLAVMIGSTSFDGFSVSTVWVGSTGLFSKIESLFSKLGLGVTASTELTGTVGLLFMIAFIACLYRLGVLGMKSLGGGHTTQELSRRFVHTLVPISLAYVIAHYFSLLAYQGQAMAYLISDPLGNGSNLFGTASSTINYNLVAANTIWYVQVGALLVGHVAGLTLAHDKALTVYRKARDAMRSQYWMLVVMVSFTSLGLWILSSTY
jgi:hypothetical protein